MKRLTAFLLSVCMVISLLTTFGYATEVVASGACGDNLTWTLDSEGTLTINGTGEMKDFDLNMSPWAEQAETVTSVVINEGATSIGRYAFGNCKNLTRAIIPESVTRFETGVFDGCSSLNNITIPKNVTRIGELSFSDCTALTNITLPESVEYIGDGAFYGCTSLTDIQLPNAICNVERSVFQGCKSLKKISLPDNVTYIGRRAFSGCTQLSEIVLPKRLETIQNYAFSETGLSSLYIPATVTFLSASAFTSCSALSSLYFHGDVPLNVVDENDRPWGELQNLTIYYHEDRKGWSSPTWKGYQAKTWSDDGECAGGQFVQSGFYDGHLSWTLDAEGALVITGYGVVDAGGSAWWQYRDSVRKIVFGEGISSIDDYAFSDYVNLVSVSFPGTLQRVGNTAFGWCLALQSVTFSNAETGIIIADSAFMECPNLAEVELGDSIRQIGRLAFYDCTALTSIDFSKLWSFSVAEAAFSGSGLLEVRIPASLESIGTSAFSAPNLQRFVVDEENTNFSSDESGMLFNKDKTKLLVCPKGYQGDYTIPEGVVEIDINGFSTCKGLTRITLPESLLTIGTFAFRACSALRDITIPAAVNSIGSAVFAECSSLQRIDVAAGNQTYSGKDGVLFNHDQTVLLQYPMAKGEEYEIPESVTEIGDSAFMQTNVKNVTIPEGVTRIGNFTFSECGKLGKVILPASLQELGDQAFAFCSSMTGVYFKGAAPTLGEDVFTCLTSYGKRVNLPLVKLYYISGQSGWESPKWNGYPTDVWDGTHTVGDYDAYVACGSGGTVVWALTHDGTMLLLGSGWIPYFEDEIAPWAQYADEILAVEVKGSVANIPDGAFTNCRNLERVTLSNSIGSVGARAFKNCEKLETLTFGGSSEEILQIDAEAFMGCTALEKLEFPNRALYIGERAFYGCSGIQTLSLTSVSSVGEIRNEAFAQCTGLKEVTLSELPSVFGTNVFAGVAALVYVPDELGVAKTWTEAVRQSCGGDLTWMDYYTLPDVSQCSHPAYTETVVQVSCGDGYVLHSCTACSFSYRTDFETGTGNHTYTTHYHRDSFGHRSICDVCGYVAKETQMHTFDETNTCTVCGYGECTMCTISGTVESFLDENESVYIRLLDANGEEWLKLDELAVTGNNAAYCFENVPANGVYILQFYKKNHRSIACTVAVDESDVQFNIKICLNGDVNGDGEVNMLDMIGLYNDINETEPLEGYAYACADVTHDSKVDMLDLIRLYNHINETEPLWD